MDGMEGLLPALHIETHRIDDALDTRYGSGNGTVVVDVSMDRLNAELNVWEKLCSAFWMPRRRSYRKFALEQMLDDAAAEKASPAEYVHLPSCHRSFADAVVPFRRRPRKTGRKLSVDGWLLAEPRFACVDSMSFGQALSKPRPDTARRLGPAWAKPTPPWLDTFIRAILTQAMHSKSPPTPAAMQSFLPLSIADGRRVCTPLSKPIISVSNLSKIYASGLQALNRINLDIRRGEIFALLGPNGAGKTTLIGIICGIVNATEGAVTVDGHDIVHDYRAARSLIGLVPQELTTDAFETVWATVNFSRGLWGKPPNSAHITKILESLSLLEKKNHQIRTLSGGMKRRVLIAKALAHDPLILFLDEPTAGVDVELRKEMWQVVRSLRSVGVTIILTTHYIEEAEQMADRIGIINKGQIIVVEDKAELMHKLGRKQLMLHLHDRLEAIPAALGVYQLTLAGDGGELVYTYDSQGERTGITALLADLSTAGIRFRDLHTTESSLEDIFVELVRRGQ
jgi:ABC-2 type transport system ATP-binding protein